MARDNIRSENNRDISCQNINIDKDFLNEALDRQSQLILDEFSHRFAVSAPPIPAKYPFQFKLGLNIQFKFNANRIGKLAELESLFEFGN